MFEWDRANIEHIAVHDVLPEEAEQVILNNPLELLREIRTGELRISSLGETDAGRVLIVVIAPRGELLRVVTAYPADRRERRYYATQRWWGRYAKETGNP
jgi:uncharacterized DUF497 family protein